MDFNKEYKLYLESVEEWITVHLKAQDPLRKSIYDAMNYSLTAGGKRLRPVLSLAVCSMLNGDEVAVLPFACAIELIHTYSLIHDDLPCMDNDDFRRGKPTSHKVFGEAMAVLSGDGLLNLAFEKMLEETIRDADCYYRAKTARLIADAAGTNGMILGQVIDLESENKDISYDRLCDMHQKKTGALIRAAVLAPAELFNAPEEIKKALESYARAIGLAFQIKDDILDFEGDSAVLGKTTGKDSKNHKSTFVTLLGREKARELLKASVDQALESIKPLGDTAFLDQMAVYIAEREK
ncbi:MAG TPA: farnesyl-diphosphate synthase [Ruminiclostridium sp.]|nr:farnesyl-diphosphate synthase [Ruminiclostridium sp.]